MSMIPVNLTLSQTLHKIISIKKPFIIKGFFMSYLSIAIYIAGNGGGVEPDVLISFFDKFTSLC